MSGIGTNTDKEVSRLSLAAKVCPKNNHQWSALLVAAADFSWLESSQPLVESHEVYCPDDRSSPFSSKVSVSNWFCSNRPLSAQNKQRPMADNTSRTSLQTHSGPGREAARQRLSAPPLANKQYCCKKKKCTKERVWLSSGACWKWMQGGKE